MTGSVNFKPLRKLVLLIASLGLFAVQGFSQKTIVYGSVYDSETKEPLPFVNVAFKNSKIGTTTDIDGNYRIETYYATDSIQASFIGYKPKAYKVKKDLEQEVDIFLSTGSFALKEVVVNAQDFEDPAIVILKRIIRNKPINNREKLDAYQYETYNRIQFDLNNLSEKFTKRKIFKEFDFIFDYIDSSDAKVSLPFFITETVSDYYYMQQPKGRKEIIRASKVSGINNESMTQFLGQMYQDVNVYENSIGIFGKNFISPISNYGRTFYEYDLVDSMFIDSKWCYRLDFTPKNEAELVFQGHFWVNDTTYALKEIDAKILKSANINFITDLRVHHRYDEVEREVWMLTREELIADFTLLENEMGFYGKKLTTYRDFLINEPKEREFYSGAEPVIVESQVNEKENEYWSEARHESITTDQQGIYNMVDSLKTNPKFMTYVDLVNFLFQGYKEKGNVEIGPVFTFLSFNNVEGIRPKFGLRTSNNFSTRLLLEGYAAYGTKDRAGKFMLGGQYFLSKKPRQIVGAYYSQDMELIGQTVNFFPRDHFVRFFTARNPQDRLIFNKKFRLFTEREWFTGFSTLLEFRHMNLEAKGAWEFQQTIVNDDQTIIRNINSITTSEISLGVRFAYQERFLSGEFERVSLGSLWPILNIRADFGFSGFLNSEYNYTKLTATVNDKVPVGPFGNFYFTVEGGKTFNPIPYPLQFVHAGNESIIRNSDAFNTMNFFEFVSDRYGAIRAEHHFEGLFLNKIPLFKRLKWREIIGINAIYGRFSDRNLEEMQLPARTYTFDNRPFMEAYVGIENIFKFIRIDAVWRLSYLERSEAQKFAILLGFDLQF